MLFELGLATADLILSELGLVMEDSFLSEWVGWGLVSHCGPGFI